MNAEGVFLNSWSSKEGVPVPTTQATPDNQLVETTALHSPPFRTSEEYHGFLILLDNTRKHSWPLSSSVHYCMEKWVQMSDDFTFDLDDRKIFQDALVERMNNWLFSNATHTTIFMWTLDNVTGNASLQQRSLEDMEQCCENYRVLGVSSNNKITEISLFRYAVTSKCVWCIVCMHVCVCSGVHFWCGCRYGVCMCL